MAKKKKSEAEAAGPGQAAQYILSCGDAPDVFDQARTVDNVIELLTRPATVTSINEETGLADLAVDVGAFRIVPGEEEGSLTLEAVPAVEGENRTALSVVGRQYDETGSTPGTWSEAE